MGVGLDSVVCVCVRADDHLIVCWRSFVSYFIFSFSYTRQPFTGYSTMVPMWLSKVSFTTTITITRARMLMEPRPKVDFQKHTFFSIRLLYCGKIAKWLDIFPRSRIATLLCSWTEAIAWHRKTLFSADEEHRKHLAKLQKLCMSYWYWYCWTNKKILWALRFKLRFRAREWERKRDSSSWPWLGHTDIHFAYLFGNYNWNDLQQKFRQKKRSTKWRREQKCWVTDI